MEVFDYKGKLNINKLGEFLKDSAKVFVGFCQNTDFDFSTAKENFVKDLFTEHIKNMISDTEEIAISTDKSEDVFMINGQDYNYWKHTNKRMIKLQNAITPSTIEIKKEVVVKVDTDMSVAICHYENDDVKIENFKGKKSQAIEWLNHKIIDYAKNEEESRLILLDLDYDENAKSDNWKTIEELVSEKRLTLK